MRREQENWRSHNKASVLIRVYDQVHPLLFLFLSPTVGLSLAGPSLQLLREPQKGGEAQINPRRTAGSCVEQKVS